MARAYQEARRAAHTELIEEVLASPPGVPSTPPADAAELRERAVTAVRSASDLLREKGTSADLREYGDFVVAVCEAVARDAPTRREACSASARTRSPRPSRRPWTTYSARRRSTPAGPPSRHHLLPQPRGAWRALDTVSVTARFLRPRPMHGSRRSES